MQIPTRMAKIENHENTKYWQECSETGSLTHGWCTASEKTIWQFLIKLKMHILYNPATALVGVYFRKMKTYVHTHTHKPIYECL